MITETELMKQLAEQSSCIGQTEDFVSNLKEKPQEIEGSFHRFQEKVREHRDSMRKIA